MVLPISYIIRNKVKASLPVYSELSHDLKAPIIFPFTHFISRARELVYLDMLHLHHLTKPCRRRLSQTRVKLKQQVLSMKELPI